MASEPANSKMIGADAGAAALVEERLCDYLDNTATATLRQKPDSKLYTHHADFIEMMYRTNHGLRTNGFCTPPVLPHPESKSAPSSTKTKKAKMVDGKENIHSNCSSRKKPKKSQSIQSLSTFYQPKREFRGDFRSILPPDAGLKDSSTPSSICQPILLEYPTILYYRGF